MYSLRLRLLLATTRNKIIGWRADTSSGRIKVLQLIDGSM